MFEKILVPTDFSDPAQEIFGHIGEIPGVKEVILFHVVDATNPSKTGWSPDSAIADAKILLNETKQHLENTGLDVQVKIDVISDAVTHGSIAQSILEMASSEKVSLIIMGARGKSVKDLLLGSVSTDVLHHTTIPLILMKGPSVGKEQGEIIAPARRRLFSKVLFPTDFSKPAGKVLSFLKEIKGIDTIVLVNVIEKQKNDMYYPEYQNLAKTNMEELRNTLIQSGHPVDAHVRTGYPPDEIISLAESDNASLIALSPHGEGWSRLFRELFVGSTTNAVVRRAGIPVFIIRCT